MILTRISIKKILNKYTIEQLDIQRKKVMINFFFMKTLQVVLFDDILLWQQLILKHIYIYVESSVEH